MSFLKKLIFLSLFCASGGATEISDANPWQDFPCLITEKENGDYVKITYRHCEDREYDVLQNMIYNACNHCSNILNQKNMLPDERTFWQGKMDAYVDVYIWIDEIKDDTEYHVKPWSSGS